MQPWGTLKGLFVQSPPGERVKRPPVSLEDSDLPLVDGRKMGLRVRSKKSFFLSSKIAIFEKVRKGLGILGRIGVTL
jgi:hypothetical protein